MDNDPIFGKRKTQHTNHGGQGPDKLGLIVEEVLQELIIVSSIGTWAFIKALFTRWFFIPVGLFIGIGYLAFDVARHGDHILWIGAIEPNYITTEENLEFLWYIPVWKHLLVLFPLFFYPVILTYGYYDRAIRKKYQRIFETLGLRNGLKGTPKLLKIKKLDAYRKSYTLAANGIGIDDFRRKKEGIEAAFGIPVESIKHGKNCKYVIITLTTMEMPSSVSYSNLICTEHLPSGSFFLGVTDKGAITQKLSELPHMLITGATGGGKSVFFKQALMGLLESSNHTQMYLVDLKGGLEMTDFSGCPNVKIIKTIDQALTVFRQAEREMKERFAYLEKNNLKSIVPSRDKKDRIIIAVDESSVLYMERAKFDPDYGAALEARKLADSIAKLARAAAINLLLATQKLDKSVIPTSVSENISGRMAFRANSLQGSLLVLGTKEAMELPEIPGRGIWSFGIKKITVQAPYIDEQTIIARCNQVTKEFQTGKRKCFNPLLGEKENLKHEVISEDVFAKLAKGSDGTQIEKHGA